MPGRRVLSAGVFAVSGRAFEVSATVLVVSVPDCAAASVGTATHRATRARGRRESRRWRTQTRKRGYDRPCLRAVAEWNIRATQDPTTLCGTRSSSHRESTRPRPGPSVRNTVEDPHEVHTQGTPRAARLLAVGADVVAAAQLRRQAVRAAGGQGSRLARDRGVPPALRA